MKILITGYKGFIGKNLVAQLKNKGYDDLLLYDVASEETQLDTYLKQCDFIFHLAGVNRPENDKEFEQGNKDFTINIINKLNQYQNYCPIVACSSIHAEKDNAYGISKKAMEVELLKHGKNTASKVFIYRLPNVFGKWCRPNYNSAVATFCHNITRNLKIRMDNPETELQLVYIDDVVNEFINCLEKEPKTDEKGLCTIAEITSIKLGELVSKLYSFHQNRQQLEINFETDFDRKLYAVLLSYYPENDFSYKLDKKTDDRGYFCECFKNKQFGQVSVSVTKPGIQRGNHWHNTKAEKFLVIKGHACIRFRKIGYDKVIEYHLNGDNLEVIDVPVGYTHSIENTGNDDLIAIIWSDELFDPEKPDTYFEAVK